MKMGIRKPQLVYDFDDNNNILLVRHCANLPSSKLIIWLTPTYLHNHDHVLIQLYNDMLTP